MRAGSLLILAALAACTPAQARRPADPQSLHGVTLAIPPPADARPSPGIGCGQVSQDLPLRAHKALVAAFGETGATLADRAPWTLTVALREATMGPENARPRRTDKPVTSQPEDMPAIDQPQQSWFNSGQGNVAVVIDASLARDGQLVWNSTVTGHAQSAPCIQAIDKVREALGDAVDELRDRVVRVVRP